MSTPSISVAMIVLNEQDLLPFCFKALETLIPMVKEVSIVDGGSTDRTWELIQMAKDRLPIRVRRIPMPDSFAEQRNAALEGCTGDWILHMDADETFTNNLGDLIGSGALDVHDVWDFPKYYTIQDEYHYWTPSGNGVCTRLFKNIGFRYERDIHEYIVYPGQTGWESIHSGAIGVASVVTFFDHTHLKSETGILDKGTRYQRFRERSGQCGIPIGDADTWTRGHAEMLAQPGMIRLIPIHKSRIISRP